MAAPRARRWSVFRERSFEGRSFGGLCRALRGEKYCCRGLATRCEVQLAWAIGLSRPVSVAINTFGTSRLSAHQLTQLVDRHFDLSVYGIIRQLDLLAPRYRQTACYGHFGREVFPWERTDKAPRLRDDAAGQLCASVCAPCMKK